MQVTILVHLENGVWWAESPEVPGFSACQPSLRDVEAAAKLAIRDILAEGGIEGPILFETRLIPREPDTGADFVDPPKVTTKVA